MVDLQAQAFGDAAIVTGVRVGSIAARDAAPAEARQPITLVWQRVDGRWQLRHVHLSVPVTSP